MCDACAAARGIVDGCVEAMLEAASLAGVEIACRRGCAQCCHCFVGITFAEAVPIALWLSAPGREQHLDRFARQMDRVSERVGQEVSVLEELSGHVNDPLLHDRETARFRDAAVAYLRHRLLCPFNARDGGCEIYPIRPLVCRAYYVAGTSDHCTEGSGGKPTVVRHPTLTQATELARAIVTEVSGQAGQPHRKLLITAVKDALTRLLTQEL